MIQNIIVIVMVLCASVYLFARLFSIRSKSSKKQQGSCACDGCPVATKKTI